MAHFTNFVQKHCCHNRIKITSFQSTNLVVHFPVDSLLQFICFLVRESFLQMAVAIVTNGQRIIGVYLNYLQALTAERLAIQLESLYVVQADDLGWQNDEITKYFLLVFDWSDFSINNAVFGEIIHADNFLVEDNGSVSISSS